MAFSVFMNALAPGAEVAGGTRTGVHDWGDVHVLRVRGADGIPPPFVGEGLPGALYI